MGACFFKGDIMIEAQKADSTFNKISIIARAAYFVPVYIIKALYRLKKANMMCCFSIRTTPFEGGKNSRVIHLTVE